MVLQVLIGLACSGLIAVLSRKTALLTSTGAGAQFFLGWIIFGLGGWKWAVPILAFFASSSALSRVGMRRKASIEHRYAKVGGRDLWQVLANGGIAGAMVIAEFIDPSSLWYVAGLGSLAAANADTWGSEAGVLSHRAPFLLTSMRRVDPGTSGGVTLLGSAAGAVGGLVVAVSGLFWIDPLARARALWVVLVASILGALFDSLLGALVQAQYRCSLCCAMTERPVHCGRDAEHARGFRLITNDTVNLLCTAAGGATAVLLWCL